MRWVFGAGAMMSDLGEAPSQQRKTPAMSTLKRSMVTYQVHAGHCAECQAAQRRQPCAMATEIRRVRLEVGREQADPRSGVVILGPLMAGVFIAASLAASLT